MSSIKLPLRIVFTAVIMSAVVLAYGFRTEATSFTFATKKKGETFDLKIDSQASWNGVSQAASTWALKNLNPHSDKFFNLGDVKPGDRGEATISLHVNKDAWVCLDFENLKEKENGRNEPELLEDDSGGANSGELADGTEFFGWRDDGDNIFEVGEIPLFGTSTHKQAATQVLNQMTYPLADSKTGNPLTASTTRYIGIEWCAGDLEVDVPTATITCDGEALGNEAQTDSFSVDLSFRAVPVKDNNKFTCVKKGTTCEYGCSGNCGPVTINVNNNATVINTTTSSSNTGGNHAGGGGTVVTGNASSTSTTVNIVNSTTVTSGNTSTSNTSITNLLNIILGRFR